MCLLCLFVFIVHAEDLDDKRATLQQELDAVDEQIAARDEAAVEHVLRAVGVITEGTTGASTDALMDFVTGNGAGWASECLADIGGAPFTVTFSLMAGTPVNLRLRATGAAAGEEERSCLASAVQLSASDDARLPRTGKVTFLIQ
jgi:hypothetical protein